jgi:DNA-binding NtrC family response regulator
MPTAPRVLIVEDDQFNGPFTEKLLQAHGFDTDLVETAEAGWALINDSRDNEPDLVLLDYDLPGMNGFEMAVKLKADPGLQYIPVIIFTVHDSLDHKIKGLKSGGDDYLTKPFQPDELIARVNAMLRIRKLYQSLRRARQENTELSRTLEGGERLSNLLGRSPQMRKIGEMILDISHSSSNVLIQGESGTGKEVVARAIHEESAAREGPFVVVNCAAYADTLLHSELFGHEKGAFTGAIRTKPGRFEQANGGAIFLDEIGEISLPTQVILLRVIQDRKFERVGGEKTIHSDARIIAATNRPLKEAMAQGLFREDLYWRLKVISIDLPPVRERREDIPQLTANFVKSFNESLGKSIRGVSPEAMDILFSHNWPGNVRELENVIERSMVLAKGDFIEPRDLPEELRGHRSAALKDPTQDLDCIEKEHIRSILERCEWNKYRAAKLMGISRSTLYSKIRKHGLRQAG